MEEVARCVEEAEWKRESLETPQQAVLEIQDDDAEVIRSNPDKDTVDTEKTKEPTVAVSEHCVGEIESTSISEDITKKPKKQKKKKSRNSVPSDPMSKTHILIAKAERIRQQILNSRKIKQTDTVHQEENIGLTKPPEGEIYESKKFENENGKDGVIADDNDDANDNENSSSSSQESSESNNSSSSSPDESDDIEKEIEDEEDQLPDELPICATTEEIVPSNELNAEEDIENGQERVMKDSISVKEECKLSKEELLQIKKEKLRASVAVGGTKKAMVSQREKIIKSEYHNQYGYLRCFV